MRAIAIAAVLLAACRSATEQDAVGVRECWYRTQPGWSWTRPAVAGNSVFFGTGAGQVVAREVSTGNSLWVAKVADQQVNGANFLVVANVVIAPVAAYTVALEVGTGRELWRYEAPADSLATVPPRPGQVVLSRIDTDGASVFIPAWGASVSAVDVRTGSVRWVWRPGRFPSDTAQSVFRSGSMGARVSGDTVFATVWHNTNRPGGLGEAWVVALDRATGRELWRVRLPHAGSGMMISSPPELYRDLLIVRTVDARVYALNRVTRQVVWQFSSPDAKVSTTSAVEIAGDVAYADGGDEFLYALRAGTGEEIWRSPYPAAITRDLLVTPRRVIFTNGGALFVLDRASGRRVASTTQPRTTDPLFSSAAQIANGRVFVTIGDAAWCFEEP